VIDFYDLSSAPYKSPLRGAEHPSTAIVGNWRKPFSVLILLLICANNLLKSKWDPFRPNLSKGPANIRWIHSTDSKMVVKPEVIH
jgi:hypothetical protein